MALFRAHWSASCSCLEPVVPVGREWEDSVTCEGEAILPINVVWMELNLVRFLYDTIHVSRLLGHSSWPWKGPFPSLNPLPTQASPWKLTVGSLLVRIPVPYSFPLIGPLPSGLALLVLYNPLFPCFVTSAMEDGDTMFLRNVGIDQHINMAPKPKN
jgi:hypothetical protein